MTQDKRFRLDGKRAIVTGASSGLGVAFAIGLAEAGADVAICARRADRLAGVRDRIEAAGRRCVAIEADVTSVDDCNTVVARCRDELGGVDVLVNNAGTGAVMPSTREEPDSFRRVIEVNLYGAYWMAQASARAMESGGSIVNIGSVLGSTTTGIPQAAYCSSKAAIDGLTRDLAQQWTSRKGIRVNTLAPGFFPSEMTDQLPSEYVDHILQRVPAGRMGEQDELVSALIFLASDASSYVSGAVLPVDGGLLAA